MQERVTWLAWPGVLSSGLKPAALVLSVWKNVQLAVQQSHPLTCSSTSRCVVARDRDSVGKPRVSNGKHKWRGAPGPVGPLRPLADP